MFRYTLFLLMLLLSGQVWAHPMPSSVVKLSILERSIQGQAKMPLPELESAIKQENVKVIDNQFFRQYFTQHIRAVSAGKQWDTQVESLHIEGTQDPVVGKYQQVIVQFKMTPSDPAELRKFTFKYDAIIHQVITHKILIYVQQDWNNGIQKEQDARQVGIIKMDIPSGKIFPLEVNLQNGSLWTGFTGMVNLGMQHIKEGTDHLLFLIVLLLPAMLLVNEKHWGKFGGVKYSIKHLLKIVTAFTIGHSVTLLLGGLGWVKVPGQPVEVLIAFSILISAVHAIYPLFPGRESFVAAGFGLIHGLAFASVLSNLSLGARTLALSILGFNIGIEMMQLFIILLIIPWLILLSRTDFYKGFRIVGAVLAAVAAIGWIIERVSGESNFITGTVELAASYTVWIIVVLALVSCFITITNKYILKPEKKSNYLKVS